MKRIIHIALLVLSVFTLTACYKGSEDTSINVKFYSRTGTAEQLDDQKNLEEGQLLDLPEEPVRQGFEFAGWYIDYANTVQWDFDTDRVGDKSFVLYAKWEPGEYNIIYDLNGGTITTPDYPTTFKAGDLKVLPLATRPGFVFITWYPYDWVDESSTIPGDRGFQTLPTDQFEDLYLYAHWDPIVVKVTFRVNYPLEEGGPSAPPVLYLPYADIIDFEELTDPLYNFVGWNSRPDGTGVFYNDGDEFIRTQRTTLYAIWELK